MGLNALQFRRSWEYALCSLLFFYSDVTLRHQGLYSCTCPMNMLPAALTDSQDVVPMQACITLATFTMMYCITPR